VANYSPIRFSGGECFQREYLEVFLKIERMGEERGVHRVLVGKPEGKRPFGRPRSNGMILRWIFRKWEGVVGTGRSWLRIGTGGGHL
jgi:hypothetical protein